jgi:alpha-amylase
MTNFKTMKKTILLYFFFLVFTNCKTTNKISKFDTKSDFKWENANLYFLLVDRFNNGDKSNDQIIKRNQPTGKLRGFEGGDLRGIIQKIDEGYFNRLGINVIWLNPIVEQIHGSVDEGTGNTYGFHGYWAKDFTNIDPSFGTRNDLKELVEKAHKNGIRIMLDAVINHTGPVTALDSVFPKNWVRTSPKCTYNSYKNYIDCTLVENLPDVLTESNEPVDLPPFLIEKWKKEGRYEQEIAELDAFFKKTGYPRAPKYYIMKWLSDYITDFGIDGYRVDTVKHVTEDVWADFSKVCKAAFEAYKKNNPTKVLDNNAFFMIGEVYGYGIHGKRIYDFGDKKVDYFAFGFDNLINFDFKGDANLDYEKLFSKYNQVVQNELDGGSIMNYISSHDDAYPYDKKREKAFEAATKLLLTPGIAQIYYGDETNRSLEIEGTQGDATLRSLMNWNDIENNKKTQDLIIHYQKLGQFRKKHIAVGMGVHQKISDAPYTFSRIYKNDKVIIVLDAKKGVKIIDVSNIFPDGTVLKDVYSNTKTVVKNGKVSLNSNFEIVLLEQ